MNIGTIINSDYEERYNMEEYYWGLVPNQLCYDIMRLKPPTKPFKVLDIGCGEGKDAVFLARNGYIVTAFDVTERGIEKGKQLAEKCGVYHFIKPEFRDAITDNLKKHTNQNGRSDIRLQ